MMPIVLVRLLTALSLVCDASGHGALISPPARNAVDRALDEFQGGSVHHAVAPGVHFAIAYSPQSSLKNELFQIVHFAHEVAYSR